MPGFNKENKRKNLRILKNGFGFVELQEKMVSGLMGKKTPNRKIDVNLLNDEKK